jgi:hypothetical protein
VVGSCCEGIACSIGEDMVRVRIDGTLWRRAVD